MMTNGNMEESIQGQAELNDVEPVIFEQLVKFAYLGLCGIADGVVGQVFLAKQPKSPAAYACHWCGTHTSDAVSYPFCGGICRASYEERHRWKSYYVYCVKHGCNKSWTDGGTERLFCDTHGSLSAKFPAIDTKGYPLASAKESRPVFEALTYGTGGLTHDELSERLNQHKKGEEKQSVALDFHAKLYILANKYLVKDLEGIALHKLHRHLAVFEIEDETIDEVIDLVLLAYSNTEDGGNILTGTNDKLRQLVMAYVATMSKALLKYESFRVMLGAGGAHTSDFMALKYAQETT